MLNLNSQAINPITHHDEMDITLDEVLRRLDHSPIYAPAFEKTFGTATLPGGSAYLLSFKVRASK